MVVLLYQDLIIDRNINSNYDLSYHFLSKETNDLRKHKEVPLKKNHTTCQETFNSRQVHCCSKNYAGYDMPSKPYTDKELREFALTQITYQY